MSVHSRTDSGSSLNEVLVGIDDAIKTTFKAKDGSHYSTVPSRKLRHWLATVEDALKAHEGDETMKTMLSASKEEVRTLIAAVDSKEAEVKRLQGIVDGAGGAYERMKAKMAAKIEKAQLAVEEANAERESAIESKRQTIIDLNLVKSKFESPSAKFDPEAAKELQLEMRSLREDLALADEMKSNALARLSEANSMLDSARKEVAGARKLAEDAKIEAANFNRKLAAARTGNVELFREGDFDRTDLWNAFGNKGMRKLELLLSVEPYDVRGRLAKLTGFFATLAQTAGKRFNSLKEVVTHALEVIKASGNTWVATLGPWVNEMVKDIVFLSLKPAAHYRSTLTARLNASSQASKGTLSTALKASNEAVEDQPTWEAHFSKSRKRVSSLLAWIEGRRAATMSLLVDSYNRAYKKVAPRVKRYYRGLVQVSKRVARGASFLWKCTALMLSGSVTPAPKVKGKMPELVPDDPITIFEADPLD